MNLEENRITTALLLVASLSLTTAVVLGAYLIFQRQEIRTLKAGLLSETELQARLLADQPLDQSLMPHAISEIGFVLNPALKRSSAWVQEGESYPVNSLGLRGPEITEKPPGVKRFVIVGDSVAFGWKLKDQDRLSSMLNRRLAEHEETAGRFEFVTVALPGWNVRSGFAFLKHHLLLLEPDLVIWWSIYNDIEETPGVIPPGVLAAWASSQDHQDSPFNRISAFNKQNGSFMPAIADQRLRNIRLVADFSSQYGIPVVLRGLPGLFEQTEISFDPPWIRIPSKYRGDERWQISATDSHPTPWANEILALGVLRQLSSMGAMPEVPLSESEQRIVEDFAKQEKGYHRPGPRDYSSVLAQIPTEYRKRDGSDSKCVLYGIGKGGAMAKAGTLFLRDPGLSDTITVRFTSPPAISRFPGSARFSVRSRDLKESQVEVVVDSTPTEVSIPLPASADDYRVFELSWRFDYALCKGPSRCGPGTLLRAGFE